LLEARASSPAFHPHGRQRLLKCGAALLALVRESPSGGDHVLCLQNCSDQSALFTLNLDAIFTDSPVDDRLFDLASQQFVKLDRGESVRLAPYQTLWLEPRPAEAVPPGAADST
jgi:hypothetical protein